MRNVPFIDATAVNRLKEFHQKLEASGTTIIISGANRQVKEELFKSEVYSLIGKNNILDNINQAIERSEELLKK